MLRNSTSSNNNNTDNQNQSEIIWNSTKSHSMQCTKFEFCGSPNRNQIQIEFRTQRDRGYGYGQHMHVRNFVWFSIFFWINTRTFHIFLCLCLVGRYVTVNHIYTIDWNKYEKWIRKWMHSFFPPEIIWI